MTEDFRIYQILIFLTALIMIIRTLVQVMRKKKSFRELFLAVILWGAFSIIGLFPNVSERIARATGFELGINALTVFSIIIIFACLLSLAAKIDKVHSNLTKFVRAEALKDIQNEDPSS